MSFQSKYFNIFSRKITMEANVYLSNIHFRCTQEDDNYFFKKMPLFDISVDTYLGYRDIIISDKFNNNLSIWISSASYQNNTFLVLDIMDIRVSEKYRRRGIGGQLMKIVDEIARENNVKYIVGNLQESRMGEPLSDRIRFFRKHGFEVIETLGAGYSDYTLKKIFSN